MEARLNDLKQAVKDKHIDRIRKAMDDVTKVSHKLAEELYRQTGRNKEQARDAQRGPGRKAASGRRQEEAAQEEVIDAEFEEAQ